MKKVLSIALATLLCLSAIASLAIVNREEDPTGKKIFFDSVSISTAYALTDYALMGVSTIADPLKTYVGNEVIFGYLKFAFNDNNSDAAEDIEVKIVSDYASFPMYLNTGGISGLTGAVPAKAHYIDKNGILQPFSNTGASPGNNGAVVGNPFTMCGNDVEEFISKFTAKDFYTTYNTYTMFTSTNPSYLAKKGDKYAAEIYVGFNGVVKASTASEGKIKAYITVAGSKFGQWKDYALKGNLASDLTNLNFQWVGPYAGFAYAADPNWAPYIDIYDGGTHLYRVYSLFKGDGTNGGDFLDTSSQSYAFEYLVQPVDSGDRDLLVDWGVGFQNLNNKRFGKITYRKGLPTSKDDLEDYVNTVGTGSVKDGWRTHSTFGRTGANGFPPLTAMLGQTVVGNNAYADRCHVLGGGAAMSESQFFDIPGGFNDDGRPKDPAEIKSNNALDSKIRPIMDWFGFTLGYYNATRDSDYENKAGWKATSEATFKYFGVEVPIADDDVPAPETGDASTAIVIVLAGSALLAAAALFFVMKKARD